jgi:polyhydroxybutyrate depolymerase
MRTVLLALQLGASPLVVNILAGCTAPSGGAPDLGGGDLAPTNPLVAARPYQYQVPIHYDAARPTPLVVLLHGYGINGVTQDAVFGLSSFADDQNLLYAYPDGTVDATGNRFWNATDACCDFGGTGVDDVAYVTAVIDDMSAHFNVDPKRIYVTGHSNGGFMSHRMACDRAARIAAIVALAGDDWKDTAKCAPSEPVAVLQVHGDADDEVPYAGGTLMPSAHDSVAGWAEKNGCAATPDGSAPPLDLDTRLAGSETTVEKWPACRPGGAAELWTIRGGPHVPHLGKNWAPTIWGFMQAHPKP